MKFYALTIAALLFAVSVTASVVEENTNGAVHYQADGGYHGDAPDICTEFDDGFEILQGEQLDGLLFAEDDERDVFYMNVAPTDVGERFRLVGLPGPAAAHDVTIQVQPLDCDGNVMDTHNQPAAILAPTPAPAGTTQHEATKLDDAKCSDHWKFHVHDWDENGDAPLIEMVWTDGTRAQVAPEEDDDDDLTYEYWNDPGYAIETVTVNMDTSWDDTFHTKKRVCDNPDADLQDATGNNNYAEWTASQTQFYLVSVDYVPITPPTSIPVSCHFACADLLTFGSEQAGYGLLLDNVS